MSKRKNIIWTVIGALLMCFVLAKALDLFKVGHTSSYQAMKGFYREKKNSLDAVYIGSSTVHAFWEPPVGWNDHGIAVWSLSMDSMPLEAIKYMIEEARKTQPNALYIININGFKSTRMIVNYVMIHRVVDYMNFSLNKLKQISWLSDWAQIPAEERLEFLFPIIRLHPRWKDLDSSDFLHEDDGMKKGLTFPPYLVNVKNLSKDYRIRYDATETTDKQFDILSDLLDYCDEENVNVLFVLVPQAISSKSYGYINAVENYIQERGYPCWDILKKSEEIGIQPDTDFYNARHTNVHGSLKFVGYLGDELVEKYGFTDKRGQPGWESWDRSAELYNSVIGLYTLPIERSHEKRDYHLDAPILSDLSFEDRQITLEWTPVEGAEFYEIFRKSSEPGQSCWDYWAVSDGSESSYTDSEVKPGAKYTYTVVPGYQKDGVKYYGKFDFSGVDYLVKEL